MIQASRRQLESLIGKLQFMSNCIKPGRLFISRLLNDMKGMNRCKYYTLSECVRSDIWWWYLFLPNFGGTSVMWLTDSVELDSEMAVDACLIGAGGVSKKEYFRVAFPVHPRESHIKITHLELWAVIVGIRVWGNRLTGKIFHIKSDNEAVATIINTG